MGVDSAATVDGRITNNFHDFKLSCDTAMTSLLTTTGDDRNIVQLYMMVNGPSNCSFTQWLRLVSYGNWCGFGNNGLTPVDGMDDCCMKHDKCYDSNEPVCASGSLQ